MAQPLIDRGPRAAPPLTVGSVGPRPEDATRRDLGRSAATALLYAAALYLLLLCFINTHFLRVNDGAVIVCELLIALATVPVLAVRLNLGLVLLSLCVCINFVVLAIFQPALDLKALRDLLFPVLFVWLGYVVANRRISERVLRNLAIIAAVLGLIEFIFPGFYASIFDALAFFKSRGFGATNRFTLTVLQVRPEGIGRSLLPFLGPRRISSFFLEPVSLGNFAVLVAAWAVSKPRAEWREAAFLFVLSLILIVMADARFGSITILVLCLTRYSGIWRFRVIAGLMPIAAMAITVLFAWFGPSEYHDNVIGRFQVSGFNLINMPWSAWFGIPAVISLDAGYGYIIQRTGLPIIALLWLLYATVPFRSDQGRIFHFNLAIYMSLNLCISGSSLFALKTTAILWFLLGTVIVHQTRNETAVPTTGIPGSLPA